MNSETNPAVAPAVTESPTEALAGWLARVKLADVPERVMARAKHIVLDGIGCALVGARLPWSHRAVNILADWEGDGDCTLVGWNRRTTASAAAVLNSTFIQGFELDDFHPLAPLHSASLVLPVLLAATEKLSRVNGETFLLAAICGFETGPRVGYALHGAEMLTRGWHSGAVFGTHAAAASAGKLIGLNAAQFEDALGLAGTQSGGLMAAQYEAMSKRMHHGFAARAGLTAAVLAQGGYTGIKRVFERGYGGFLSTFGEGHSPDASQVSRRLGSRWETELIMVKQYAVMGGLQLAVDGILQLKRRADFAADEVESIDIDVADAVFHHGGWAATRPLTPIGAQMNMAYATAVAVIDGAALAPQFVEPRINADDVWNLMTRISVRHDPSFDSLGVYSRGATRLTVNFRGARTQETLLMCHPNGQGIPEITNEMVVDKFRRVTAPVIERDRQEKIEALVLRLEELTDIDELIDVLAQPVGEVVAEV